VGSIVRGHHPCTTVAATRGSCRSPRRHRRSCRRCDPTASVGRPRDGRQKRARNQGERCLRLEDLLGARSGLELEPAPVRIGDGREGGRSSPRAHLIGQALQAGQRHVQAQRRRLGLVRAPVVATQEVDDVLSQPVERQQPLTGLAPHQVEVDSLDPSLVQEVEGGRAPGAGHRRPATPLESRPRRHPPHPPRRRREDLFAGGALRSARPRRRPPHKPPNEAPPENDTQIRNCSCAPGISAIPSRPASRWSHPPPYLRPLYSLLM